MFNTGFRGKRANDGTGIINPQENFVQNKYPVPTITSWTISGSDDDALDPAGGQTVLVNGGGFFAGCAASVNGVTITPVTVISANQISFTSPALAGGSYALIVYNSTGGGAILVPGLVYSSVPTYTTPDGSIGSGYETTDIDTSVVATSDSSITYTITSGALPSGASMTSGGVITGTYPALSVGTSETFYFDITATDAEDQDVTRSFSLTTNIDVVTWVTPSSGATISLDGTSYSQALSATDAAGYSVSYTADSLPTGLTLSSGTISGTPTVDSTTTTLLTATAATTNRSATNTITWVVALSDTFWKNVSLLLSGTTPTTTFINDASLNNSQLTIVGDAKPNSFNPYSEGYYSNFFDGTGDSLTTAANSTLDMGTGDFTIECFVNTNGYAGSQYGRGIFALYPSGSYNKRLIVRHTTADNRLNIYAYDGSSTYFGSSGTDGTTALVIGAWTHIAFVRQSGVFRVYINGVQDMVVSNQTAVTLATSNCFDIGRTQEGNLPDWNGSISNFRVIKGTCLYPSGTRFTSPTTVLTNISGTSLLTCQSNRLIDKSVNNIAITKNGDTKVSSVHPFTTPTTAAYNTQYSTYFDGTGDYLTVSGTSGYDIDSATDYTVEAWIYNTGGSGTTRVIVSKDWSSGVTYASFGFSITDTNKLGFVIGSGSTSGTGSQSMFGVGTISLNTWYHIAFVKSSTTYTFYINGSIDATGTVTGSSGVQGNVIQISRCDNGFPYTGIISNLRIVKTAVYTGAFTTPTNPLTATQSSGTNISAITGTSTSLLTCQDSTLKDNSTNAYIITSAADARPVAVSPFTMTTSNTTVTSLGSAYFDGTGDYLSLNNSPSFAFGTGDYTIEAWVFRIDSGTQRAIVDLRGGGYVNVLFYLNTDNKLVAFNSSTSWIVSSSVIPLNQWTHVALTRSGTSAKLFINGVVDGTATNSDNNVSSGPIYIGRQFGSTTNDWLGYIQDVRITKGTALYTSNFLLPQTTLTPVTNTQLLTCQFNGGATNNGFVDQSSYNNIITRNGNVTQGTFSPYSQTGWSAYFPGSTSQVSFASNAAFAYGTGDFTWEMWFNALSAPNGLYLLDHGTNGGTLSFNGSRLIYYSPTTGVGSSLYTVGFGNTFSLNTWYHVAAVRRSGTTYLYLNGTLTTSASDTTNYGSAACLIGQYGGGNLGFVGHISNVRLVKGTGVYTGAFTPPTSPLSSIQNAGTNILAITSGVSILTCQSPSFIDTGPNNLTVGLISTPSVQAYSPFGSVTSVPTSYSTYFGAQNTYIATPNNTNAVPGTGDFTVEGWFYLTSSASTDQGLFNLGWYDNGILLRTESSGFDVWINNTQVYDNVGVSSYTINAWYHIALSRQGTNLKLFLNGTQLGTTATNSANITASGTPKFMLGAAAHSATNTNVIGYMSNWRVVKGQSLYNGLFTPSTSPLTKTTVGSTGSGAASSITGTVELLTLQSSTIVDNSYNNAVITVTGSVLPRPFNPFGTTNTTSVSYTPSVNGGSMYFDGTGDYLQTATGLIHTDITQTNYTIECWVYNMGTGAERYLFSQRGSGSGWEMRINSDNTVSTFFTGGTTFTTTGTVTGNAWTHVAATRLGTTIRVFINGVQSATGTQSNGTSAYASYGLWLGYGTTGGGLMLGYISDARVIRGQSLYNANFYPGSAPATNNTTYLLNGTGGGIIDYHSSNDLETVGNTQLASEDPYGGSYYSNQLLSSGYLTTPANSVFDLVGSGGTFTLEAWVYFNSYNTMASSAAVMAGNFLTSSGWFWGFYGTNTISYLTYTAFTSASGTPANFSIDASHVPLGKWVHLATVNNSGTMTTYLNGVATGGTTSAPSYTGSGGQLAIGVYQQNLGYAGNPNWYISNLRITKGVAVYTGNFTVPTGPLAATQSSGTNISAITGTSTSILTCQSNTFKDNSSNAFTLTRNTAGAVKSINPFQNNTGKSLYFNGTSNALLFNGATIPGGAGTAFTVEFWIYFPATPASLTIFRANGNGSSLCLSTNSSSQLVLSNVFVADFMATTTAFTAGVWNFVSITRSAANLYSVYFNGSSAGTPVTYATSIGILGMGQMYFAYNTYTTGYSSFYLKDFRVTNGVARNNAVPTAPFKTN